MKFNVGDKVIVKAKPNHTYSSGTNGMLLTVARAENLGERDSPRCAYWFVEPDVSGKWEEDLKKADLKSLMGDKI